MNATVDTVPAPAPAPAPGSIWRTLALLWPQVWRYRARVGVAFAFLVVAKLAVIDKFHLSRLGRFMSMLKSTTEADSHMLDRTMLLFGSGMNS